MEYSSISVNTRPQRGALSSSWCLKGLSGWGTACLAHPTGFEVSPEARRGALCPLAMGTPRYGCPESTPNGNLGLPRMTLM
jgi:hypothetical protein